MGIGRVAGDVLRGVEETTSQIGHAITGGMFDNSLRLGVTGLSQAGKTVFITSLVANLLDRGRMGGLQAVSDGRIEAAYLQPQPDDTIPRFEYERHLAALTGPNPHWPESTRQVSQLRLSFRVRSGGVLGGLRGARVQYLDIIDYPGEWLLDLTLLDKSFAGWSSDLLAALPRRDYAKDYLAALAEIDPDAPHDEARAQDLAARFTDYLRGARAAGLPDISPGRFLLPGDLAGSPALTFAPMAHSNQRGSLGREMERRFEAYKSRVVRPFFRDHFARIDRQIVLADVLGAVHAGPDAVAELGRTMTELLSAFRPGRNAWLTRLLGGKRVERILFAATKADHLHHSQHAKLTAIMAALLRQARDRADFAGARTEAMAIAAVRATVEDQRSHGGETLDCVRGTLMENGKQAAFFAGDLPDDPMALIGPARDGAAKWLDADFGVMQFAPVGLSRRPGDGLAHIRLDRAAQFLIGDML
ncbi:YcjX family protein [Roseibaca sp. Y0-43]|uniref:YcjX family protein n=1 Tax=Roseibaca sp. Y0-43 TaxID=2816854 RepID=UPI001D0C91E5|nr:YcjX family protein [Roseibaca sp. Y0-43]MCC1482549.1 YcjX family protein [Roseibaca sp. Y0-43]